MESVLGAVDASAQKEYSPYASLISSEDRSWLESLGCIWPKSKDEADWLSSMNELMATGSIRIKEVEIGDNITEEDVLLAREHFFGLLTAVDGTAKEFFSERHPYMMPVDTIIYTQRVLSNNGINISKAIYEYPAILCLSPETVTNKLDNLAAHGIDAARVVSMYPSLIGMAPETVTNKLDSLTAHGIDAARVINKCPVILTYSAAAVTNKLDNLAAHGINAAKLVDAYPTALFLSPETVTNKLDNLAAHGIDAARVVNQYPTLIGMAPETVHKKLRIIYAAARSWGMSDYQNKVNRIVEEWPVILGYKPDKIKTLIRIASRCLTYSDEVSNITIAQHARKIVTNNLESTLAGYLIEKAEMHAPKDIRRIGGKYAKLGKGALLRIIEEHSDDPTVKVYLKGYPINRAA